VDELGHLLLEVRHRMLEVHYQNLLRLVPEQVLDQLPEQELVLQVVQLQEME